MSVSGFESVQSFGLAQILCAVVDLDLAASPIKISLSTAPYLIMAEILSAHQVLLYPRGVNSILSRRARCFWQREVFVLVEQTDILCYSRTSTLTEKTTKLRNPCRSIYWIRVCIHTLIAGLSFGDACGS